VMTEILKRLLIAGKGEAPEPELQKSEDAAAPPTAARKSRRDADTYMGCSLPFLDKNYSAILSLSVALAVQVCNDEDNGRRARQFSPPISLFTLVESQL
jgi:hypothetical protein